MKLNGKTAVITGAASGIGLATAQAFAAAGASLVLGDINIAAGEDAARQLNAAGHKAIFVALDVTDELAVARFREAAYAQAENVDVVVNVAGWSKVEHFVNTTPYQGKYISRQILAFSFIYFSDIPKIPPIVSR